MRWRLVEERLVSEPSELKRSHTCVLNLGFRVHSVHVLLHLRAAALVLVYKMIASNYMVINLLRACGSLVTRLGALAVALRTFSGALETFSLSPMRTGAAGAVCRGLRRSATFGDGDATSTSWFT